MNLEKYVHITRNELSANRKSTDEGPLRVVSPLELSDSLAIVLLFLDRPCYFPQTIVPHSSALNF